jgi:hypothetical protein
MGGLRIMRPGSVIGEQQHYLCAVDAALQATRRRASGGAADSGHGDLAGGMSGDGLAGRAGSLVRSQSAPGAVAAEVLAEQVCAGMLRRSASSKSLDCVGSAYRLH